MKNKLPKVLASGVTLLSFPIVAFAQTENLWDEINKDLEGSDQGLDLI
jgi:hypothetical protein